MTIHVLKYASVSCEQKYLLVYVFFSFDKKKVLFIEILKC